MLSSKDHWLPIPSSHPSDDLLHIFITLMWINESERCMRRGIILGVGIAVIFVSLVVISFIAMEKAPVVKVKAEVVTDADGKPTLRIIDVEQSSVHPLKAPRGHSTAAFPSVDAIAFLNLRMACYWASTPYTGDGTYEFVIGFLKGVKPEKGDMIRVYVKVCDANGKTLTSNYRDMKWE